MFYEAISPLTAFGAGILSVLSPCILPLLPAVLATSAGKNKLRPLAIVLGVIISFTIMGIITSAFGAAFRTHLGQLKILAEIMILLMGFALLFEISLFNSFSKFPLLAGMNEEGPVSGFLLGLSLGVLWIPCIGPILGSILTMVALEGSTIQRRAHPLILFSGICSANASARIFSPLFILKNAAYLKV